MSDDGASDHAFPERVWQLRLKEFEQAQRHIETYYAATGRFCFLAATANAAGIVLLMNAALQGRFTFLGDDLGSQLANASILICLLCLAVGIFSALGAWLLLGDLLHEHGRRMGEHIYREAVSNDPIPITLYKAPWWKSTSLFLGIMLAYVAPVWVTYNIFNKNYDIFRAPLSSTAQPEPRVTSPEASRSPPDGR